MVHTKIKKLFRLGYICCQHLAWQCVAVRTWRLVLKFLAAWLSDGLDSLLFLDSFTKFFRCCSSARSSGVQKVSFVEGIGEGVGRKTAWLKKMSRARSAGLNEDLVLDGNWGASSVLVSSPPCQSCFRPLAFCF